MQKQYDKWITGHAMCLDWRKYHLTACIVGQRELWQMSSEGFSLCMYEFDSLPLTFSELTRMLQNPFTDSSQTHHPREGRECYDIQNICVFKNWCEETKRRRTKCSTRKAHLLVLEMHLWTGRFAVTTVSGIPRYRLEKTRATCKKQTD